jgi:hypothetical protein
MLLFETCPLAAMQATQATQVIGDLTGEAFKDIYYTICDSSREVRTH